MKKDTPSDAETPKTKPHKKASKKKLIIANWKMNPTSIAEAKKLFLAIRDSARKSKNTITIVCPPFVFIDALRKLYTKSTVLGIGAQNVSLESTGAFTGDVSAMQLKSVGAGYAIIGHSETRARGESDHDINLKVHNAILEGLTAIVCVGEGSRDDDGEYLQLVRDQISAALLDVDRTKLNHVVIAYEPIWAIGQNRADIIDSHEVHKMMLFIRKTLKDLYNDDRAMETQVIYGGSVVPRNAADIMGEGEADGVLVGGASLRPHDFAHIIEAA